MKKIIFTICATILMCSIFTSKSHAKISEHQFNKLKIRFLKKTIRDNPHFKTYIRGILSGIVPDGSAGMRLLDKFALFLYDMKKSKLYLKKTKFFYKNRICMFMLILHNKKRKQSYTLYLEYRYSYGRKLFLRDAFFSAVFMKRQKRVINFFKNK